KCFDHALNTPPRNDKVFSEKLSI
ncbi:unnamed protein product, partial [Leptidea sinapis]